MVWQLTATYIRHKKFATTCVTSVDVSEWCLLPTMDGKPLTLRRQSRNKPVKDAR